MLNLWGLLIFEVIFFFIFFALNYQDIMSPSVLMTLVFIFSTIIAILNKDNWNISYSFLAAILLGSGIFAFGMTDVIIRNSLGIKKNKIPENNYCALAVDRWKVFLIIIVDFIVVILVYREVTRIAGTNTWFTNIFYAYRTITSHTDSLTAEQYMNGMVSQSMKVLIVSGFLFTYIFINNVIICKEKLKENFIYLFPPLLMCIMTLITGVRTNVLRLTFFTLICWYILLQYKNRWKIKTSWKFIRILIIALFAMMILFSALQSVLGRSGSTDFFTVISNYSGAPIQHFNQYIQAPANENIVFGQETFSGIRNSLYNFGIVKKTYSSLEEYRYLNNTEFGNVYTLFRRFIQDFGIIGMYFATILVSAVISMIYNMKIRGKRITYNRMLIIIEYGYLYYIIAISSIDNILPDYLNLGTLLLFILLHVMTWFLFKFKLRLKY